MASGLSRAPDDGTRRHRAALPPAELVRLFAGRPPAAAGRPPVGGAGLRVAGPRALAAAVQGVPVRAADDPLPRDWPPVDVAATAVLAGRRGRAAGSGSGRRRPRPAAPPVGGRGPGPRRQAAVPAPVAVPRGRLRRRPFSARGLRLGQGRRGRPGRCPLVRPDRPRAGPGRAAGGRRAHDADRDRHPVADRLEVRGARLPPHLLGRRLDAGADPRAGRVGRLRPRLWTRFPDETVAALVGADGVQEFPVALVSLGEGDPAIRPGGAARAGSVGDAPIEFPLVTLAQHAGDLAAARRPVAGRAAAPGRRAGLR